VVITPSHQFPTGAVLSQARRKTLLDWARRRGSLVIEDDYDAEFRYDGPPVRSLHADAPDCVVYVGTTSKMLSPALRLGWILAPDGIARALADMKRRVDRGAAALDQLALASFIERGELDHHLARMRTEYSQRRIVLIEELQTQLPHHQPRGIRAGLHVMIDLPRGVCEMEVVNQASQIGVALMAARPFWSRPERADPALVLGYGAVATTDIREGVARLAEAVRAARDLRLSAQA
jgi:GntR family transcriptional regulator / MocR family aminotransferase